MLRMKKAIVFLGCILMMISCKDSVAEKPDNLIAENKMVDILTDISILEAIKVKNPGSLAERNIQPNEYIYKKYHIDSLQFSKSDKFYATDIDKYLKIYEKVTHNIEQKKKEVDSLVKKGINLGKPEDKKEGLSNNKIKRFRRFFDK
jgi:hypothetical protein